MEVYRLHGGGDDGRAFFIHSLAQIRKTVAEEQAPDVCISIFREKQYPIRGSADDRLLSAALNLIPYGEWFSILTLGDRESAPCIVVGLGETHEEMRECFSRLRNKNIRFGRNPYDLPKKYFEMPDDVWVASSSRHSQPNISKNRSSYASFAMEPDRYRSQIALWADLASG